MLLIDSLHTYWLLHERGLMSCASANLHRRADVRTHANASAHTHAEACMLIHAHRVGLARRSGVRAMVACRNKGTNNSNRDSGSNNYVKGTNNRDSCNSNRNKGSN
jgi:hypothetical protein